MPVAVPYDVLTLSAPDVAPAGTIVVICVGLSTVNEAFLLLNATVVTALNPDPRMITVVPMGPLEGKKPDIEGVTWKLLVVLTAPLEVITVI